MEEACLVCLTYSSDGGGGGGRVNIIMDISNTLSHSKTLPHSVLLQWHVKDPSYSTKSEGGRLYLNTHTPLTQRSQNGLTMPLSRHSVETYQERSSHTTCQGTYQERSSHATRQGTLCHSRLSLLSHCGLILAYRVKLVYAGNLH